MVTLTRLTSWSACVSLILTPTSAMATGEEENPHSHMIAQIEEGLRPALGAKGQPSPVWTIEERMEHHGVPAISIAVAFDGEVVWAKAYGVREKGSDEPVDTNTLFQAASLSKPIAAVAALTLVDQGLVDLDAPAREYLKSWQVPENEFTAQRDITLRHLLSHRAGTTIHGFNGYETSDVLPTSAQILDGAEPANTPKVTVDQVPGESRRYSGGGYQVAQMLIEDVTGRSFAEYVGQSVFASLGLTLSNYDHVQSRANVASGHVGSQSRPMGGPGYWAYPELAAAGVWTTPTELLQFAGKVSDAREGNSDLISRDLARQLVPDNADKPGLGFGLHNPGDGVVFVHNGHNPGYSARMFSYGDGRASVAILTNSDSGGKLIREVASAIGHAYGWKQDGFDERETIALSEDWQEAVAGQYAFDPESDEPVATITLRDGMLWIDGALSESSPFYPTDKTSFFIPSGLNFTLDLNESGEVEALDVEGEFKLLKISSGAANG